LSSPGYLPGPVFHDNDFEEINMTVNVAGTFSNLLRKFGLAGFVFFLVKGTLWLVAPLVFIWFN